MTGSIPDPRFKSVRLKYLRYSEPGAYFVTIVTARRESLFGVIEDGQMVANEAGQIVIDEWLRTIAMRTRLTMDAFCLMPNHFHAVVVMGEAAPSARSAPLRNELLLRRWNERAPDSLSTIMAGFKAATTKRINELRCARGQSVWQHRFHEHVVRGDRDLAQIRDYILGNPAQWSADHENPERRP
ncbi:transposase [candidate division KSB1 bacterium]|nr:transposase [candidate division KSB1 bacterium]